MILKKIYKFFKAKLVWKKLDQKYTLIYDEVASEDLVKYLDQNNCFTLETRMKKIYIHPFIKSLVKEKFKWTPQKYFHECINEINPEVIISLIDNNLNFWRLKNIFKDKKLVLIQNGMREKVKDIFGLLNQKHLKKFEIDKVFVFGASIAKEYSKYIKGEIIPIGSFHNNTFDNTNYVDDEILYISQWDKFSEQAYPEGIEFFKKFNMSELFLFKLVSNFAIQKKMRLKVLARTFFKEEEKFFKDINKDINFLKRDLKSRNNSYQKVLESKFIISCDSTLGYEALARGKRVGMICCRGKFLNLDAYKFGWPTKFEDRGPFWTNLNDKEHIYKIFNYLTNVSDKEWIETSSKIIKQIIVFNYGNTIIKNNLEKIGVKFIS